MTDPIKKALHLQELAKEKGVDVFDLINSDTQELPSDNPFLNEQDPGIYPDDDDPRTLVAPKPEEN